MGLAASGSHELAEEGHGVGAAFALPEFRDDGDELRHHLLVQVHDKA